MDIKTKYSIDQKVWLMEDNKVVSVIIHSVNVKRHRSGHQHELYELNDRGGSVDACVLFESKEELLKSL